MLSTIFTAYKVLPHTLSHSSYETTSEVGNIFPRERNWGRFSQRRETYTICPTSHNCLKAQCKSAVKGLSSKVFHGYTILLIPMLSRCCLDVPWFTLWKNILCWHLKAERGKKVQLINFGPQFHILKQLESKYLLEVKGQPTQKMQQRMYFLHLKQLHK